MDPWADSSAAWAPSEANRPDSPKPAARDSTQISDGPVDPWAETSHASAAIPVIPTYEARSKDTEDEPQSGNDFDPWGGNAAPMAPLSTDLSIDRVNDTIQDIDVAQGSDRDSDKGWNPSADQSIGVVANQVERLSSPSNEATEQGIAVDEDDPWGSGAAAQRIKLQNEVEAAAQRREILRLQEEAKGKSMDDKEEIAIKEEEIKPEAATAKEEKVATSTEAAASAPVVSGWRSLFSKASAKADNASDEMKSEKEAAKVDTNVAKEANESKESPRSSTSIAAPRLWQAPTILGNHTRSTSSASRSSSNVEVTSSTKGPGWEITTKKPQQSGTGGGFIQSFFGAASTSSNPDDKSTITATKKEEKTGGLNRFGRGLQPPPVVSAADDEDDSFDTSETGIEWDSSNIFDDQQKKKPDLLSDDGETTATGSTMGKLLGKLRGRNVQPNDVGKSNDMSNPDVSWLENVDEESKATANNGNADLDWLAFMDDKVGAATSSSTIRDQTDRIPKVQLVSSTSRGTPATKIIPLAPPPSGSRTSSPFSFNSTTLAKVQQPPSRPNTRVRGEFDKPFMDEVSSPNLSGGYRDDFTDNNASFLNGRPGPPDRKTSSFMRTLQGRPSKGKYDYDEDDEEEGMHNDNFSAFRDEPQAKGTYRDYERRILPAQATVKAQIKAQLGSQTEEIRPRSIQGTGAPKQTSHSTSISPPPSSNNKVPIWDRNGPLLAAPPGRPSSVGLVKQNSLQSASSTSSPSNKPATKTLSQGTTLTNDDLSFFENL